MGTQELKYKAVYNWVLDNINSGALKVGEKLPRRMNSASVSV